MRTARRYLVFRLMGDGADVEKKEVARAFRFSVYKMFGELGLAQVSPRLLEYSPGKGGIVAVRGDKLIEARAAIAVTNFATSFAQVVEVCGSLKKAQRLLGKL